MTLIFASVAGLIHFYIFVMESLLWGRPKINRVFGVSPETAEHNRIFAFNQGFYNLFLALAAAVGLIVGLDSEVGKTLVVYSLASMLMASLVLLFSNKKLLRPALIQGIPPLLGLLFWALQ
jgi:putative membrane protein